MRLGIDVGGTKTAAVLLDARGVVVGQHRVPTLRGEGVVDSVLAAARPVLRHAGVDVDALDGVGLGIPGVVGHDRSTIRDAVHLGIDAFDVGAAVGERLGVRVLVENDVNAAVVGARHLLGDASDAFAYLGLGTGIAAGILLDGAVWRGATGVAGEIGHVPVPGATGRCRCGQTGCLETVAAGWALAERWDEPWPAARMLAAARAGSAQATAEWEAVVDGIAHAVRLLVLTLDVGTIAIGGGLRELGAPLLDGIRERLGEWALASPFVAAVAIPSRVHMVPAGSQPAAVGAAIVGSSAWKS
ncbi:ROK family protein [Agrococcus sp. SGAir0287]|uniref:ROK family protein n=1 Tax=Agrococcus sp. SGAir0287 TaxID=2070347 RepID=UPI0010CCE191|nr:ROK family protein [Agrococcus sp. SGAir0287]QCR20821.1 sugar kinase [Agrococcus sp. SGAir0287]